jgi:hypothetical protein
MLIDVPPPVLPELGVTLLTIGGGGGGTKIYPFVNVPFCASELVTTTLTVPSACAGVLAVIELLLTTATLVAAALPNETIAPGRKPVPEIVMDVPPVVGPEMGAIEFTTGGPGGAPLDFGRIVVSLRSAPGAALRYVCGDKTI